MSEKIASETITKAVSILKAGGLVAFPTETVYGLGADAINPTAVRKIFAAKGRPVDHPLIVHLADAKQLNEWAQDIPEIAWRLAEQFWPGPLTLILKRAAHVLSEVTGDQDTIGLRIPAHPIAQALLKAFGSGIAAPSANKFGRISPTQASHVQQEFSTEVDLIIDGGACTVGIESTIIDLSSSVPRILRPGSILPGQLNKILNTVAIVSTVKTKNIPRVSGMLLSHYAPVTPLKIIAADQLIEVIKKLLQEGKKVSVLAHSLQSLAKNNNLQWLAMPSDPINYAHELYANMRAADAANSEVILVEAIPDIEEWSAIQDRIQKAAVIG